MTMANTSPVYARIDTSLKENAEGILTQLGISPSEAIKMLYSQIVLVKGNHDSIKDQRIRKQFSEICDYKEIKYAVGIDHNR